MSKTFQVKMEVVDPVSGKETFVVRHIVKWGDQEFDLVSIRDLKKYKIYGMTYDILRGLKEKNGLHFRNAFGMPQNMQRREAFVCIRELKEAMRPKMNVKKLRRYVTG